MMIFPLLSCEKKYNLQKVTQNEHEAIVPEEEDDGNKGIKENDYPVTLDELEIKMNLMFFEGNDFEISMKYYNDGKDVVVPVIFHTERYYSKEKYTIDELLKTDEDSIYTRKYFF